MRRTHVYPALLAAVLVVLSGVTIAPAQAAGNGFLTISTVDPVRVGSTTPVQGILSDAAHRPVGGASVEVWRSTVGSTGWAHVSNAVTDSTGHYTSAIPILAPSLIKSIYRGGTPAQSTVFNVVTFAHVLAAVQTATSYHLNFGLSLGAGSVRQHAIPQILVGSTWTNLAVLSISGRPLYYSWLGTPGVSYQTRWLVGSGTNVIPLGTTATKVTIPVVSNATSQFTIAVYPDTQQEVMFPGDTRYVARANYLVAQQKAMNLKFMFSVGDNANWDNATTTVYNGVTRAPHWQYAVLQAGNEPLQQAGFPYSLAVGNHDSEATDTGGSCRQSPPGSGKCPNTYVYQRDTTTINSYFNASSFGAVSGAFEPGKIDNIYSEVTAGGKKFMILSLELWPRKSVVDWAVEQVKGHPHDNVIITTHSYLTPSCGIQDPTVNVTSDGQAYQYGSSSPEYLWNTLIKPYANIRMVVSGHVGTSCSRVDTGTHGNKIVSLLNCFHSNTSNPIRFLTFDTAANSVSSYIYGPGPTPTSYPPVAAWTAMNWVS